MLCTVRLISSAKALSDSAQRRDQALAPPAARSPTKPHPPFGRPPPASGLHSYKPAEACGVVVFTTRTPSSISSRAAQTQRGNDEDLQHHTRSARRATGSLPF